MVLLTALEQEMIEWALKGFPPMGPDGLKPTPGELMRDVGMRHVQVPGTLETSNCTKGSVH